MVYLLQWWLSSLVQQAGFWTSTIWQVFNKGEPPATLLWAKALQCCHERCLKGDKFELSHFTIFFSQLRGSLKDFCPTLHFPLLLNCLLFPHPSAPWCSPFFPQSFCLLSCPSLCHQPPPRGVLSTEHCVVPFYLFLRASSLSLACDIRSTSL